MPNPVERALRRHRFITLLALTALILLAWVWLLAGAGTGMKPYGSLSLVPAGPILPSAMVMDGSGGEHERLSVLRGPITFFMWWTMMIAMMLPSASPTILLYARSTRHSGVRPAAGSFLAGYLAVWGAFSVAATLLQAALQDTALLSPLMASRDRRLSGIILIAAGLYQFTPLKDLCLRHCRDPAVFLSRNYRPGRLGALRMGALHGAYCLGCCWVLMALLFVGGVMNLLWIALLALVVAGEKLLPFGRGIAMAIGLGCLMGGIVMLVG